MNKTQRGLTVLLSRRPCSSHVALQRRIAGWLPLCWLAVSLLFASALGAAENRDKPWLLGILRGPSGPAGFCVHLGCGEGALTAELAQGDRLAVHALEADAGKVQRARDLLQARGLYGQAAVEPWTAPFLPYADNVVNVLVAENPGRISRAEMLRVLAPLGTLWTKRGDAWQATQKPWPKSFDEWTHARHGADGNMVSRDAAVKAPTGLRWIAGPAQDAGGRKWYYDHVLVSSAGRNFYVYEDQIVARDAFNGRLLWTRAAKAYTFKESGTSGALKLGSRTSKVRPVALGNRLYAAIDGQLVALDAATGRTVQMFATVDLPREIAVADGVLLLSDTNSIRAFELSGALRWQWSEAARRMVAGDGKVFYLKGENIVALDLATGKERWRTQHPKAAEAGTCSYYHGALALERSTWRDDGAGSGIVVLSGKTGKILWTRDYLPGMTHFRESRVFFAEGLLWLEIETQQKPVVIKSVGFDPLTGEQRKEWPTRGLHCSVPVATEHYLITAELEFTDLASGARNRARMVKSACRLPFVPANGLLYTFPVQCECFPMLRGYMGLAQTPSARDPGTPRLQKGPAYGRVAAAAAALDSSDEWPMYRRDRYRSGSTPGEIPNADLKPLWEVQLAQPAVGLLAADWSDDPFVRGLITPPVCAAQTLLVAVPDRHRVVALDAKTGAERWRFTAGGRVDTPPTIVDGLGVFGAHDGYVYCVSLADGQLAWRFRAAPQEARIPVYGQMESLWPVAGGVLVEDGVAYFAAGRHPASDGGMRVLAVRVRDGEVVWEKPVTDSGMRRWYAAMFPDTKMKVGVDYEPVDLFVRDGDSVAMSRWRFAPQSGELTVAFNSTNYQAFTDLAVPRGVWGYGIRQTKLVLDKLPTVFSAQQLTRGTTNDAALLLAGNTLLTATLTGELKLGDHSVQLAAPPVHDGLIAAYGRVYAAARNGKVYCLGK